MCVCIYHILHILHNITYIYIYVYIHCFTHIFSQKNWHLQLTSWGPHQRAGGVLPHHGMEIFQRGLQLVISSGHSNSFAVENPIQMDDNLGISSCIYNLSGGSYNRNILMINC